MEDFCQKWKVELIFRGSETVWWLDLNDPDPIFSEIYATVGMKKKHCVKRFLINFPAYVFVDKFWSDLMIAGKSSSVHKNAVCFCGIMAMQFAVILSLQLGVPDDIS